MVMSLINQPATCRPSWSTGHKICTSRLGRGRGQAGWEVRPRLPGRVSHGRLLCGTEAQPGNPVCVVVGGLVLAAAPDCAFAARPGAVRGRCCLLRGELEAGTPCGTLGRRVVLK